MGIATIGSGLGTVALAPIITVLLVNEGYYGAMLITGALMLNNCVSGALYRPLVQFTKSHKKRNPKQNDGSNTETSLTCIEDIENKTPKSRLEKCGRGLAILKNVTFLLYGLQITAMSICIQTYLTFLPGIAEEYGASKPNASFLLSIVGISDMFSRFVWGFFFDLKFVRYR